MTFPAPSDLVPKMAHYNPDSIPDIFNRYVIPAVVNLQAAVAAIGSGVSRCSTTVAMTAGSIIIADTSVTANTCIQLTHATPGGTMGNLSYVLNPGVGYTINSDNVADTSTVSCLLSESA